MSKYKFEEPTGKLIMEDPETGYKEYQNEDGTITIVLDLPQEVFDFLINESEKQGITVDELVNKILRETISRIEAEAEKSQDNK